MEVMNTTGREISTSYARDIIVVRTFCVPRAVDLLEDLHGVRTTAAHFAVPEQQALRLDVPVDEAANRGSEGLLLVGTWVSIRDLSTRRMQRANLPIQMRYLKRAGPISDDGRGSAGPGTHQ